MGIRKGRSELVYDYAYTSLAEALNAYTDMRGECDCASTMARLPSEYQDLIWLLHCMMCVQAPLRER